MSIRLLLEKGAVGAVATVGGWVKNKRSSKRVVFLTLRDGSSLEGLQVVVAPDAVAVDLLHRITVGASLLVRGKFVTSPGREQAKELIAQEVELLGEAVGYPLQPKRHTLAFLRGFQHLRMRTDTFGAIARIRHLLGYAVHTFFHEQGFCWFHAPIITGVDAEGAGAVFSVGRSMDRERAPFFGAEVALTVSGQLAGEAGMMGLGKVYTFGPTFRAEDSHTTRHLAEFWMVEPEMAFFNLQQVIDLAEALIKHLVGEALLHCGDDLAFLEQREAREAGEQQQQQIYGALPLRERLQLLLDRDFVRVTYAEALRVLQRAEADGPKRFEQRVRWGEDLQREHERHLMAHFGGVVVVRDFPRLLKAFYMRQMADGRHVAAMDVLLPGIGEVVGGSEREERLGHLEKAMVRCGMDRGAMSWYLDSRRFGTVPHGGFGLGFDRLVAFVTGMENVRDVVPFPRTPGQAIG